MSASNFSNTQKLQDRDYTVGWICALSLELSAAILMLDKEHDPLARQGVDKNTYIFGQIGEHNVVIACLPEGSYGTISAASVARDMVRSFGSIRFGLMVGIGAGIPSNEHQIRLGDVVVSTPTDTCGGVIQYDMGKIGGDGQFTRKGSLNTPPQVLLNAVTTLKARHKLARKKLGPLLKKLQVEDFENPEDFTYQGLEFDRLFQADYPHQGNTDTCDSCDKSKIDPRLDDRPRPKSNEPAFHYGIIASGNQLVRHTVLREQLRRDCNACCIEMEAAGLMNHFPCLVIRGICDYADSHKNDRWQQYAALTAAAYAKQLLSEVIPEQVKFTPTVENAMKKIEGAVNEMRYDVQDAKNAVKELGFEQRREKIDRWLAPPDPSTNYNRALQQRQEGTGFWFLQSDAFKNWKTQRNSFLWLYGIPGCGKTILSSTVIEHLEGILPHQPLLYFYFDFNDTSKQTLDNMVRSLISRLYYKCEDTWKQLDFLFSSCEDGSRQPTCESLCKSLLDVVEQTKEVWIVMDALDECSTRKGLPTEGLLSWIRCLLNSEQTNVHLLVTSRPEQDIKSVVSEFAHSDSIVPIQSDLITHDIHAYVRARVREDEGLKRWRQKPEVQDEIETQLMEKADGMFRWAACQLDALENCLEYRTLQKALASLPKTLDETYSRILEGIPSEYKQNATRLLQFLTYSERPLSIKEAIDAIAVDTEGDQYFNPKHRMPDPGEITCFCSGLVVLVSTKHNFYGEDEGDTELELQLAHFSVKEYLTSERLNKDIAHRFQEVAAKASIATVCLAYLLDLNQDISKYEIKETFPLAQYSARYWMSHAVVAEGEDEKLQNFIEMFFSDRNSYQNCYSLYDPDRLWLPSSNESLFPKLCYASCGGLVKAVQFLLKEGADVNVRGGRYCNALQAASAEGYEKIVELLLKEGADVNTQGGDYGSALKAASARGYKKIVELLLKEGADVNAQGGIYGNALQAASAEGYEKIVELLLKKGANVNAQGRPYDNALQAASERGHEKIVKLLLEKGAKW